MLFTCREVRIGKNCARGLEYALLVHYTCPKFFISLRVSLACCTYVLEVGVFFFEKSISLEGSLAEISRKFSAVRWFDKTEDCIFPRSFILRSNVQSFNLLPSFNLTIYLAVFSQSIAIHNLFKLSSPAFTELFLFIYSFRKYTSIACI